MKKRTKRVLAGSSAIGLGVVGATVLGSDGSDTTPWRTATVDASTMRSITTGTGTVQPTRQATLSLAAGGTVMSVSVQPGDRVEAQQVLVALDDRAARLELDARRAALREARARLMALETQVTDADRSAAAAAAAQAASGVEQARAALRRSRAVAGATGGQLVDNLATVVRQRDRDRAQHDLDLRWLSEAQQRLERDTAARDQARARLDAARAAQDGALTRRAEIRDILNAARQEVTRTGMARDAAQRALDNAIADQERQRAFLQATGPLLDGAVPAVVVVSDRAVVQARTVVQGAAAAVAAAEAEVTRIAAIAEGATDIVASAEREVAIAQARHDTADARVQASQPNLDAARQREEAAREALAKTEDQVVTAERTRRTELARADQAVDTTEQQVRAAQEAAAVVRAQNDLRVRGPRPAELAVARAGVETAAVAVTAAETAIERLRLTAPFSGVVGSVAARVGEQSGNGAPMVTLIDDRTLVIRLPLPEVDTARLPRSAGATVRFESLASAPPIPAVVQTIEPTPSVVNGVSTYTARVSLNQPPTAVRVGMTASVEVLLGTRENVVTVPAEALSERDGSTIVRVIGTGADGRRLDPVERAVRVGERADGRVEILDGVRAGDVVVLPSLEARS